jgi:hypothetical protein
MESHEANDFWFTSNRIPTSGFGSVVGVELKIAGQGNESVPPQRIDYLKYVKMFRFEMCLCSNKENNKNLTSKVSFR